MIGNGAGMRVVHPEDDMRAFDRLPPVVRLALAEARYNYAAGMMARACDIYEPEVVAQIIRRNDEEMAQRRGAEYRCA